MKIKLILLSLLVFNIFSQHKEKELEKKELGEKAKKAILIDSAVNNKVDQVKSILAKEVNINAKNIALVAAAHKNNIEIVKILLKSGANINSQYDGYAAISWAAENPNGFKLLKYLVNFGADINIKNEFSESPLYLAINYGNIQQVFYLLEIGANIDSNIQNIKVDDFRDAKYVKDIVNKINDTKNNLDLFKDQSELIKILLSERWLNKRDWSRLEKVKNNLPEFYKIYIDIFKKAKNGTLSDQEIKAILAGNSLISQLARRRKVLKNRYKKLIKFLNNIYELKKIKSCQIDLPKTVAAKISSYL